MTEYTWPGVYVEEVPSAMRPIVGVGVSVAAFIGLSEDITGQWDPKTKAGMPVSATGAPYEQAPANIPQPVSNWTEFTRKFGDIQKANQYLAQAVFGFFNNGGSRCWVARITQPAIVGPLTLPQQVKDVLELMKDIDEIGIAAAPLFLDESQDDLHAVQQALVDHCQEMQDRTAILDSAGTIENDHLVITGDASGIWRPRTDPKGYGAFYFPWIFVADPIGPGRSVAVPPCGHVAGVYARTEAERGVQKAPANEIIRGALDVRYPVNKFLQGDLNPYGVNCIRSFGSAIKVYGARTLASDPAQADVEWWYISVRRLVNFLRRSIETGMQWVVFEPNGPDLWASIRRNVGAFLNGQWAAGALVGNSPEEAFYVRCDETTNPPEVRAVGQVVTEIGVAVVRPAEFVIFRLAQWSGPEQ